MMTVARDIKGITNELQRMLDSGVRKDIWGSYVAWEMHNTQLGLVGLGRIGGHVSGIAKAIGMKVVAYDPYISDERFAQLGVEKAKSLEALAGRLGLCVAAPAAQRRDLQADERRAFRPDEAGRGLYQCLARRARRRSRLDSGA